MVDASASIAGNVSVQIGGNLAPFQAALAQAEAMATAFDAKVSAILGAAGGGSSAFTATTAAANDASAAIAQVTAPAAAASAAIDKITVSSVTAAASSAALDDALSGSTVSAASMAAALAATGGNLAKITPEMLGLATATDAAAEATATLTDTTARNVAATTELAAAQRAATVSAVEMGAAQQEAVGFGSGLNREFTVLGAEIARGNFSRIPGSLLVMNERLGQAGTSVLTLNNAMGALGQLGSVIFNPFVLGFLAITVGSEFVLKLFENMSGGSEKAAEEALKRQKQYIDDITAAFPQAGKALNDYLTEANKLTPGVALSQNADLIKTATDQFAKAKTDLANEMAVVNLAPGRAGDLSVSLAGKVGDLVQQLESGSLKAKDFEEDLADLKIAPGLDQDSQNILQTFIDIANTLTTAQASMGGLADNAARLKALGLVGADFANILPSNTRSDASFAADNLAKQAQSAAAFQAKLATINATTPAQKQAAAEQSEGVTLDSQAGLSQALKQQEIEQAGQLAYASAIKAATAHKGSGLPKLDPFQQAMQSAKDDTANLAAQQQALGLTAEQADKLTESQKLLNEATKKGNDLSPAQIAAIDAASTAYAKQKAQLTALTELYNTGQQSTQDFFSTLKSDLQSGTSLWGSLGDAASKALDDIANKALSMAADGIWNMIFGSLTGSGSSSSSSGGIGSLLGSIFHFASGTNSAPGGLSLVGENGPELMNVPRGAQIIPAPQTRGLLAANSNVANSNGISFQIGTIDARGAQAGVGAEIANALNGFAKNQLPNLVRQYNANPNRRGFVPYPTGG